MSASRREATSTRTRIVYVAVVVVLAGSVVGCSHGSSGTLIIGTIRMQQSAGVVGLPSVTIAGEVVVSSQAGHPAVRSVVGRDGRFRLRLAPGDYVVHDAKPPTGHLTVTGSPTTETITGTCGDQAIRVDAAPVSVTITCTEPGATFMD